MAGPVNPNVRGRVRQTLAILALILAATGCAMPRISLTEVEGVEFAVLNPRILSSGKIEAPILAVSSVDGRVFQNFYPQLGHKHSLFLSEGKWVLEIMCNKSRTGPRGEQLTWMFTGRAPETQVSVLAGRVYEVGCEPSERGPGEFVREVKPTPNHGFNRTPESSRAAEPGELSGGAG